MQQKAAGRSGASRVARQLCTWPAARRLMLPWAGDANFGVSTHSARVLNARESVVPSADQFIHGQLRLCALPGLWRAIAVVNTFCASSGILFTSQNRCLAFQTACAYTLKAWESSLLRTMRGCLVAGLGPYCGTSAWSGARQGSAHAALVQCS